MSVFGTVFGGVFGDVFGSVGAAEVTATNKGQGTFLLNTPISGVTSLVAYAQNRTIAEATAQTNIVLAGDGLSGTFDFQRGVSPNVLPVPDDIHFVLTVT